MGRIGKRLNQTFTFTVNLESEKCAIFNFKAACDKLLNPFPEEPEPVSIEEKKKTTGKAIGDYDLDDPFIDDSEVLIEQKAPAENELNFYVFRGELKAAVKSDSQTSPKKPKKRKIKEEDSTKPIVETKQSKATPVEKEKATTAAAKKAADSEQEMLQAIFKSNMENLKAEAKTTEFDKNKFPASLKPYLLELVRTSLFLSKDRVVDDSVFDLLIEFLPFSKNSLLKLVQFKVIQKLLILNKSRSEELYAELKSEIKSVTEKYSKPNSNEELAIDKQFKWTESIKQKMYDIVRYEMELSFINHYNAVVAGTSDPVPNDQKTRKATYAKLMALWPDKWMSNTELANEYSAYKRKVTNRSLRSTKSSENVKADFSQQSKEDSQKVENQEKDSQEKDDQKEENQSEENLKKESQKEENSTEFHSKDHILPILSKENNKEQIYVSEKTSLNDDYQVSVKKSKLDLAYII